MQFGMKIKLFDDPKLSTPPKLTLFSFTCESCLNIRGLLSAILTIYFFLLGGGVGALITLSDNQKMIEN